MYSQKIKIFITMKIILYYDSLCFSQESFQLEIKFTTIFTF